MLSLSQVFKSKTVWATAALFIFNGVQGTWHLVSADQATTITTLLGGIILTARIANTQNK